MNEPIEVPDEQVETQTEEAPSEPTEPAEPSEEEQAEEETPEAPEAPEEPSEEQPQALSEKEVERAFQKLDKSANVWRKRVGEIMGGDASMLQDCPLCEPIIPGFVMPTPQLPERFPAVRTFMGDSQPRELQRDPKTETCDICDGEGVLDTGSKVMGQDELACWKCGGKGWIGERGPVSAPAFTPPPAPATSNGPIAPAVTHEDQAEIERLRAKGIVVIVPAPSPAPVS